MFPYIKKLVINDCYAYQGITIDAEPDNSQFKHIIITGDNGSGKTTILNRLDFLLSEFKKGNNPEGIKQFFKQRETGSKVILTQSWQENEKNYTDVDIEHTTADPTYLLSQKSNYILSYSTPKRELDPSKVESLTKENELIDLAVNNSLSNTFVKKFKQYLVNKKASQALDFMASKIEQASEKQLFFDKLTGILQDIFDDVHLSLEFENESFEFSLHLSSGQVITFNQLSSGFSAYLSILFDLLMRVDLIRAQIGDKSYDPCGFVLIDEPETHLHLSMQYRILPTITTFFPNLQLIVATHSPAIISSLKDAVVMDLSSKLQVADWVIGGSYSELMIRHFGLKHQFSPLAQDILNQVSEAVRTKNIEQLKRILTENERFLTPVLRLEIESQIWSLQN